MHWLYTDLMRPHVYRGVVHGTRQLCYYGVMVYCIPPIFTLYVRTSWWRSSSLMTMRSLVLALLCASALALTSDSASAPGKVDTKPKLQTEPQPPPPRLGVVSAAGLGLAKLSPLKCYAIVRPYLKNPMAVPKRMLAFLGLMLFSFYMLLSALTSVASLMLR